MKLNKSAYVAVIMACMFVFVALIGIISIRTARNILEENAAEKLQLISENGTLNFSQAIDSIEQSVLTLTSAAIHHLDDFDKFKSDSSYVDSYTESLTDIMLYSVEHTTGAMSVYIRYNPDIAYPTSGSFYVKNKETGVFEPEPPTDFSKYSEDEAEHIGWYYEPVQSGGPLWMKPYDNNNIHYRMISYVVPLYINGEVMGVIGMDIDYDYICSLARNISVYETGYAFLVNKNGQFIYHPDYELYSPYSTNENLTGFNEIISQNKSLGVYSFNGINKTAACTPLDIGMILCITAPNSEIYRDAITLQYQIIIVATVSLLIIALISTIVIRHLFKISETDELTEIHNRKYFLSYYNAMDKALLEGYSLFIFDIDNFKQINDKFGHCNGDIALKFVAQTAKSALGKSSVIARWGGDEFIGLVKTEHAQKRLEDFRRTIEKSKNTEFGQITVSIGVTETRGEKVLAAVTEAADTALYCSKSEGRNRLTTM